MANEIEIRKSNNVSLFEDSQSFEHAQRVAQAFASSELVPKQYQRNVANCLVAMEVARSVGASVMSVFQNLNIIHGKPSWSSTYIIGSVNACGKFEPLRFRVEGEGDVRSCVVWTRDKSGEVLEGPPVSIAMAKAEGWFDKQGSKWKTMPDLMLRYRAAAFFGRLYAPEILMGLQTEDEHRDIIDVTPVEVKPEVAPAAQTLNEKIKAKKSEKKEAPAPTVEAVVVEAEPIQGDGEVHF